MSFQPAEQAPTLLGVSAPPLALAEPSDLDTAVRVARTLFADYGDSSRDGFSYPEAYGALREALRLVLRTVGTEQDSRSQGWTATMAVRVPEGRCPAAHPEDPTPCSGPPTVTILDTTNAGADGCQHHGARLLASLDGGRVYGLPHSTPGTAIRVFKAAAGIRPFCWVDGPRTRDEQLSRDEVRARSEQQ
ncbi:hypothetical protein ACFZCL_10415 [Streptomyces sp. NPDC008159]|uniref:hypothetical protein n=1 Tax=Streptomyces sp. NPDC008159 TaxID=3364817 RepID=UPI0036EBF6A3